MIRHVDMPGCLDFYPRKQAPEHFPNCLHTCFVRDSKNGNVMLPHPTPSLHTLRWLAITSRKTPTSHHRAAKALDATGSALSSHVSATPVIHSPLHSPRPLPHRWFAKHLDHARPLWLLPLFGRMPSLPFALWQVPMNAKSPSTLLLSEGESLYPRATAIAFASVFNGIYYGRSGS